MSQFVFIIESPSHDDLADGVNEGQALCSLLSLSGVPHSYQLVCTLSQLRRAVQQTIHADAARLSAHPIVHLSAHSINRGLQLTDGTEVTWKEFADLLRSSDAWMAGPRLLAMSTCEGFSAATTVVFQSEEPAFRDLVGTSYLVAWTEAAVAFISFYHQLFKGTEVGKCVEVMSLASGSPFKHATPERIRDSYKRFEAERGGSNCG